MIANVARRKSSRAAFWTWLAVLFFVPVWVGVNAGVFLAAITCVTLIVVVVESSAYRFVAIDGLMLLFVALSSVLFALGEVRLSSYLPALLEWVLPYVWGRIVFGRVDGSVIVKSIAAAAVVTALLALIEFGTGTNVFVLIPGSGPSYRTWGTLQERAGLLRAEGAFGHSIALGGVLAMSSAFVLSARVRTSWRLLGLIAVGAATVATFSRIGLLTLALTVALSLLLVRDIPAKTRAVTGLALVVAAAIVTPLIADVFSSAGDEAGGSAGYRTDLLVLLGRAEMLGGARNWEELIVGDVYLGHFAASTDNAFISIVLRFGYVPTVALFAVFAAAIVAAVRARTFSPATVAIIGQVPSLVAVAFITQYGMFLWFVVGLSVSWTMSSRTAQLVPLTTDLGDRLRR